MVRVGSAVDGGLDEPALGGVVGATGEELEFGVLVSLVDGAGELGEGGFVNDGAAEVGEVGWLADAEGLGLGGELGEEVVCDGGGDVGAGGGAALLALEFKGAADGLHDGVAHVGRLVHQVEVLAACLADHAWVSAVFTLGDTLGDLAVQAAEDGGAAGEVQGREVAVVQHGVGDFLGITGNELDDIAGETGFDEDLVHEVVGGNGRGRGLPDHHVTHQGRGRCEVTANGREVEGADGVDEAFQGTVFHAATSLVCVSWMCRRLGKTYFQTPEAW